ncbi:MAG: hypothetical protein QOE11_1086, partial [Solirubrobacteraceae bacterium]|nr:hypothetical protein [Solirubrobacteraceae bacterium]
FSPAALGTADISADVSQAPAIPSIGQLVTMTMTVTNGGPADATGVVLIGTVEDRQQIVSADPSCTISGASVTCAVGSVAAGQSAARQLRVRQIRGGTTQFVVSVSGDQPDPTLGDHVVAHAAAVADPGPDDFQLADDVSQLPRPRLGSSVNIARVRGVVTVRLPGGADVIPVEKAAHVPLGSIIDTTSGQIRLYSVGEKDGTQQNALFYDGAFKIGQITKGVPVTVLSLTGEDASVCDGFRPASGAPTGLIRAKSATRRGDPAQNHLWGDGKGHFRTKGKGSYATVRGTLWRVENHCFSTRTTVRRGVVAVFDRGLRRTVLVNAGERYVARIR